ncbi:hypothetical protein SUGI_0026840 [Cryptomeria japonica]|nr:hypothetical protein SUGI_0026840 [Cryptomeria japonica]
MVLSINITLHFALDVKLPATKDLQIKRSQSNMYRCTHFTFNPLPPLIHYTTNIFLGLNSIFLLVWLRKGWIHRLGE